MSKLDIILVADNDLTRTLGLMKKPPLKEHECAFFEFPSIGKHSFWNKNVSFPISLIFCDSDHVVKDIKYLKAEQSNSVSSDTYDIKYVIEAHVEAPQKLRIEKGSKITLDGKNVKFDGK